MPMDIGAERDRIVASLRALGKPGGDAWLRSYLGSPAPVLGLTTSQTRAVASEFVRTHRGLMSAELNRLAAALWSGSTIEEKVVALMVLGRFEKLLDDESWSLADRWVDGATGWALSDGLASGPIATMVYARRTRFREILRWTKSENFWRRRASTYALRAFVFAGELDKPFVLLEKLLYDEEFWVQRAVGTWLRECWKKDRKRTEAFLRRHVKGLPRVVITVATERAPKAFREELRKRRGREGRTG